MAGTSLTSVSLGQDLAAVLLRTVVMVAVIAVVVYERLGPALLRKAVVEPEPDMGARRGDGRWANAVVGVTRNALAVRRSDH